MKNDEKVSCVKKLRCTMGRNDYCQTETLRPKGIKGKLAEAILERLSSNSEVLRAIEKEKLFQLSTGIENFGCLRTLICLQNSPCF